MLLVSYTSSNILILPSQFCQIRFESCWLHCSKCRILFSFTVLQIIFSRLISSHVFFFITSGGIFNREGLISKEELAFQFAIGKLNTAIRANPTMNMTMLEYDTQHVRGNDTFDATKKGEWPRSNSCSQPALNMGSIKQTVSALLLHKVYQSRSSDCNEARYRVDRNSVFVCLAFLQSAARFVFIVL